MRGRDDLIHLPNGDIVIVRFGDDGVPSHIEYKIHLRDRAGIVHISTTHLVRDSFRDTVELDLEQNFA